MGDEDKKKKNDNVEIAFSNVEVTPDHNNTISKQDILAAYFPYLIIR